jgi:hypothetical protein
MPLKKARAKKLHEFWVFSYFCAFFLGFLLLTFVRGISETRHQQICNQHKILRFFDTHIDIFQEKKFWDIIALFVILKCKCEKNCTFSNILQKVKSYFLPISIILCVIPIEIPKKYKIEAPYCERFRYSGNRSAYSPAGNMWTNQSWEYMYNSLTNT